MKKRIQLLCVLAASFGLVAAACGSSDDTGDENLPITTAAEITATSDTTPALNLTPGEGVTVTAARGTRPTGYMQAAIYAAMLQELGYEVSDPAQNEFGPASGYVAMAEGEVDFWANSWYPEDLAFHSAELTDGSRVGDQLVVLGEMLPASGLQGFLITGSVAKEREIVSLNQINNDPELVALFDTDANGLANINGCPPELGCSAVIQAMIERNEWTNLEQVTAGYDAMMADSLARVDDGAPAIQYAWSPSGYLAFLIPGDNVLWLSLGGQGFVCDGTEPCLQEWNFAAAGPAALGLACTEDPCWPGWPAADITVTANKSFSLANPAATKLFEIVQIEVIDVVNYSVRYDNGETAEEDVKAIAQEWIEANRDLVDGWLDEARQAAS